MKAFIESRMLLTKHRSIQTLSWMILPLILTVLLTVLVNKTSDDFRIPVAVIFESSGELTGDVNTALNHSDYMDVEVFDSDQRRTVMHQAAQYQYDSVFIFPEDFEADVDEGTRRNIIESYYTERTLFYEPTKEIIASVIQERFGEIYAVDRVMDLKNIYAPDHPVTERDIIEQMSVIEADTNLINQTFQFKGEESINESSGIDPLHIWAYTALLFTFFIFEFAARERKKEMRGRMISLRWSERTYLMYSFIFYTVILLITDIVTLIILDKLFDVELSILSLFLYRLVINMAAFLPAFYINHLSKFYRYSIIFVFILISLEVLLPLLNLPYLTHIHFISEMLNGGLNLIWIAGLVIWMIIWKRGS